VLYERSGSGTGLLLIPGLGCDKRIWPPDLVAAFSRRHDVIRLDNRGVGTGDERRGPCSISQMADDAAELLGVLAIPQVHVLGWSMGGMIAMELAIRYPSKVTGLVVASAIPEADAWMKAKQSFNQKLAALPIEVDALRELIARMNMSWMFAAGFFDNEGRADTILALMKAGDFPLDVYRWQSQALQNHNATAGLGSVKSRSLVIVGKEDILTPLRYSRAIVAALPRSELLIIDGCGHALLFEKTEQFGAAVLDFLAQVDTEGSPASPGQ